ncbi:hypothetical protein Bca4012_084900 [Brassica carinata]
MRVLLREKKAFTFFTKTKQKKEREREKTSVVELNLPMVGEEEEGYGTEDCVYLVVRMGLVEALRRLRREGADFSSRRKFVIKGVGADAHDSYFQCSPPLPPPAATSDYFTLSSLDGPMS